jgi:hypothetical protein
MAASGAGGRKKKEEEENPLFALDYEDVWHHVLDPAAQLNPFAPPVSQEVHQIFTEHWTEFSGFHENTHHGVQRNAVDYFVEPVVSVILSRPGAMEYAVFRKEVKAGISLMWRAFAPRDPESGKKLANGTVAIYALAEKFVHQCESHNRRLRGAGDGSADGGEADEEEEAEDLEEDEGTGKGGKPGAPNLHTFLQKARPPTGRDPGKGKGPEDGKGAKEDGSSVLGGPKENSEKKTSFRKGGHGGGNPVLHRGGAQV